MSLYRYSCTLRDQPVSVVDFSVDGGVMGIDPDGSTYGISGSITWAPPTTSGMDAPWSSWAYRPGTPVTLSVWMEEDDGTQGEWTVLTGQLGDSTLDAGSGQVTSEVIDMAESLSDRVESPCIAARMPPVVAGDVGYGERHVGLHAVWSTAHLLDQLGWESHTATPQDCVLRASMCGSTWADRGTTLTSVDSQRPAEAPLPVRGDQAYGMLDPLVRYQTLPFVSSAPWLITWDLPLTEPAGVSTDLRIHLRQWDDEAGYGLYATGAYVSLLTVAADGTQTIVASYPRGRATRFGATWNGSAVRLWAAADGEDVWYSGAVSYTGGISPEWATVKVWGRGTTGAVQVARSVEDVPTLLTRTPRARIQRDYMQDRALVGIPPIIRGDGTDILAEQHRAEALALWVAEDGTLRSDDPQRLVKLPVRRVISADPRGRPLRLMDCTITESARTATRAVYVDGIPCPPRISRTYSIAAYRGSSETLDPADPPQPETIHPQDGQHWLEGCLDAPGPYYLRKQGAPGFVLRHVGVDPTWASAFNRSLGTWVGGTVETESSGDFVRWASGADLPIELAYVDRATLRLTTRASVSSTQRVSTSTPEPGTAAGLRGRRTSVALPEIRTMGLLTEQPQTWRSATVGPYGSAVYRHDGGVWVQGGPHAQRLADYIATERTRSGAYTVTLTCALGPVMLGDRVRVDLATAFSSTGAPTRVHGLDGLVTRTSISPGDYPSMTLTVRVQAVIDLTP